MRRHKERLKVSADMKVFDMQIVKVGKCGTARI